MVFCGGSPNGLRQTKHITLVLPWRPHHGSKNSFSSLRTLLSLPSFTRLFREDSHVGVSHSPSFCGNQDIIKRQAEYKGLAPLVVCRWAKQVGVYAHVCAHVHVCDIHTCVCVYWEGKKWDGKDWGLGWTTDYLPSMLTPCI